MKFLILFILLFSIAVIFERDFDPEHTRNFIDLSILRPILFMLMFTIVWLITFYVVKVELPSIPVNY